MWKYMFKDDWRQLQTLGTPSETPEKPDHLWHPICATRSFGLHGLKVSEGHVYSMVVVWFIYIYANHYMNTIIQLIYIYISTVDILYIISSEGVHTNLLYFAYSCRKWTALMSSSNVCRAQPWPESDRGKAAWYALNDDSCEKKLNKQLDQNRSCTRGKLQQHRCGKAMASLQKVGFHCFAEYSRHISTLGMVRALTPRYSFLFLVPIRFMLVHFFIFFNSNVLLKSHFKQYFWLLMFCFWWYKNCFSSFWRMTSLHLC